MKKIYLLKIFIIYMTNNEDNLITFLNKMQITSIYDKLIKKYNIKDYDSINDMTEHDREKEINIIEENYQKSCLEPSKIDKIDTFIEFNYAKSLQYKKLITFNIYDDEYNDFCKICKAKTIAVYKYLINNMNNINSKKIDKKNKLKYINKFNKSMLYYNSYICNDEKCIRNSFDFDVKNITMNISKIKLHTK